LPLAAGSDVFRTGDTPIAVIARRVAGRNATSGDSDRRSADGITILSPTSSKKSRLVSLGCFPLCEHFHVGFSSVHITNAFTPVISSSPKNRLTGHRRDERLQLYHAQLHTFYPKCQLHLLFCCITLLQSPVSSAHHLLSTDRDALLKVRPQLYSLLVHRTQR